MMARNGSQVDREDMEKIADKCLVKKDKEIEGFGKQRTCNKKSIKWILLIILVVVFIMLYTNERKL